MKNQIPDLKGDVKFKLYKIINIYGDFIPVFEFNYNKIYAGYMKGVKSNRLKMSNCILISTKVKNHKLVDEIIYHEVGHYTFAKYSGIDFDRRIEQATNELDTVEKRVVNSTLILNEVNTRLEQLNEEREVALKYQKLKTKKHNKIWTLDFILAVSSFFAFLALLLVVIFTAKLINGTNQTMYVLIGVGLMVACVAFGLLNLFR